MFLDKFGANARISRTPAGDASNGSMHSPSLSADGRFVVVASRATDVVGGEKKSLPDILVLDRQQDHFERASVSSSGLPANQGSHRPSMSADGRLVAFESLASNLVHGAPAPKNIYIHDCKSGQTECITRSPTDCDTARLSADGNVVAFCTYAGGKSSDVYAYDCTTKQTSLISVPGGNANSGDPVLSADGRYIAFSSHATNLVFGDTNTCCDVFLHDRVSEKVRLISVTSQGVQADGQSYSPSISADGRYIAFISNATRLGARPDQRAVFVHDAERGTTTRIPAPVERCDHPALSADGRYVAFQGTARNHANNIFVHDRDSGETVLVSRGLRGEVADGHCYEPALSADGTTIVYGSIAANLQPGAPSEGHNEQLYVSWNPLHPTARQRQFEDWTRQMEGSHPPTIEPHADYVTIDGVRVPKRRLLTSRS